MRIRCKMAWMVCVVWTLGTGCGEEAEQVASYTLYGTLTSTTVNASGATCYLKLVESGAAADAEALLSLGVMLIGPGADYQFTFVPEGQYTIHAFIDMDADASDTDPLSDTGDLMAPGRPVILFSKTRLDYPDQSWHWMP
jgi:hypothetical protein